MTLRELNALPKEQIREELFKCCGSSRWANLLSELFPYNNKESLLYSSEKIWKQLDKEDWLEAFTHHPKIGDVKSLQKKFASTAKWASGEQSAVSKASDEVIQALAYGNSLYEDKFGFIFIVCATGKSADEMLGLLKQRLPNNKEEEILIAAEEQNKITAIRLEKLLAK